MSLALARKYRPKNFSDLIGQETISQTLAHALDNKRLSHAYLFSGLRGSGKTSTARIFAKALLCEKGESSHPCGSCSHCAMASENRHMDIIEMDAASNRGIDDIKEIIEHTKYKPSAGRYKIFIVDEVHMLTPQAFNALLKTLEEPPDFVKFILATTDPLKLPATILSRTQHFRFKKIPQTLIASHLEHILGLEKIDYEKEAIEIIARSGAGSLRDALTLLDQAIVYANGYIDIGTVTEMLGIIDPAKLDNLIDILQRKDENALLDFIKEASEYEAEMIIDEMTLHLKTMMLERKGTLPPLIIERFFRILADAKSLLALGSEGEFVLSLTLFKMLEAQRLKEIDAMIKTLEKELHGVVPAVSDTAQATPDRFDSSQEVITISQEEILAPTSKEKDTIASTLKSETASSSTSSTVDTPPASSTLRHDVSATDISSEPASSDTNTTNAKFRELLSKIYDRDYDLGKTFEEHITFVSFDGSTLVWESSAQDEAKTILRNGWSVIKLFVEETFGIGVKIDNIAKKKAVTTGSESLTKSDDIPDTQSANAQNPLPNTSQIAHNDADSASMIEEVEMKSSCIAPDAGDTEAAKEKDPAALLDEPMIKKALDLFHPKKVRIKRNV